MGYKYTSYIIAINGKINNKNLILKTHKFNYLSYFNSHSHVVIFCIVVNGMNDINTWQKWNIEDLVMINLERNNQTSDYYQVGLCTIT